MKIEEHTCEAGKSVAPYKYIVYPDNHPEVIREAMRDRPDFQEITLAAGEEQEKILSELHFIWKPFSFRHYLYRTIMDLNQERDFEKPIIYNHIQALQSITSKTGILHTLRSYYLQLPAAIAAKYTILDSMPCSYILQPGIEDDEYFGFLQRYKEIAQSVHFKEAMPEKHCEQNLWLLKPANANQGRGIQIFNTLKEVKSMLSNKSANSKWVAQKYIERPLLYRDRKFDIRMWVVVTDRADIFLYKDGYIRTASEKYSLATSTQYVHLTNNCLQKFGSNYGLHEEGNTLSFKDFQAYLEDAFPDKKLSMEEHIFPRIKDLICDTILALKSKIIVPHKKRFCNFELLGYDFMIDEDFRVWLIEVNTNPYLGVPNPYIKSIMPNMIQSMLELVLDPVYPLPAFPQRSSSNKFELLYCEKESYFSSIPVCLRRGFSKELIYPFKECNPNMIKLSIEKVRKKLHYNQVISKTII